MTDFDVKTPLEETQLGGEASESEVITDPCLKIDVMEQPPMQVDDSEKESDGMDDDLRLVVHSGWKPVIPAGQVWRQESIDSLTASPPRKNTLSASHYKKSQSMSWVMPHKLSCAFCAPMKCDGRGFCIKLKFATNSMLHQGHSMPAHGFYLVPEQNVLRLQLLN